jgi:hypothetical protein
LANKNLWVQKMKKGDKLFIENKLKDLYIKRGYKVKQIKSASESIRGYNKEISSIDTEIDFLNKKMGKNSLKEINLEVKMPELERNLQNYI